MEALAALVGIALTAFCVVVFVSLAVVITLLPIYVLFYLLFGD